MNRPLPQPRNYDENVVAGFGDEWTRFDQSGLDDAELRAMFDSYFGIFPWHELPEHAMGFDLGCGSGRWAKLVAPRVGKLICIDASAAAIAVARRNLNALPNCECHVAPVDAIPLQPDSADFGYSLGVLHHIPDTEAGLRNCVSRLRRGAPFLLYLYYAFDQRPWWFRGVWRVSEAVRFFVSKLPHALRWAVSQMIAAIVYWPLARFSGIAERFGVNVQHFPLSFYRNRSFYVMRTDALDRFGTRLEKRFTRSQIEKMMTSAGLIDIRFSSEPPYWCAVGRKA